MKRISIIGIEVINNEISETISIFDFSKKIDSEIAQKIAESYLKKYIIL